MTGAEGLARLREDMAALEAEVAAGAAARLEAWGPRLGRAEFAGAAANLAHFLALRAADRTDLQRRLERRGLSTLGRSSAHVMPTLRALRATLDGRDPDSETLAAFEAADAALEAQATALFGPAPEGRSARILVTLEPAVALDPAAMGELIRLGAQAVRINCAHDGPEDWRAMAAAARAAAAAQGRDLRVLMDLGGPKIRTCEVSPKPAVRLHAGDRLFLRFDAAAPAPSGARSCGCTLPEALRQVGVGAAAAIDDGKILATVEDADPRGLWLRVDRTKPGGAKLKADKGLNFPGTALRLSPLTDADIRALRVVTEVADLVGYSFVQQAGDVDALLDAAAAFGTRRPLGVIAKIETELAFRNLPELIVAAAGRAPFGVMIARGDLAVEIGFARLSEVQEEILWLCEAARVPVVWATEVLASLVKTGLPSRGDHTDAAAGARAECVMLNKGPHLAEGVRALDDVLRRAQRHMAKTTARLAALRAWAR